MVLKEARRSGSQPYVHSYPRLPPSLTPAFIQQHYFKAHAYRVTPRAAHGLLSVDGESYPLQPFTVECHRALGTFLSPYGRYAADFNVPKPGTKTKEVKKAQKDQRGDVMRVQMGMDEETERKSGLKGLISRCFSS